MQSSLLLGFALVAAAAAPALAQETAATKEEHRLLDDTFNVTLGGFLVDFSTDIQVGGNVLTGSVQFEDDFALEPDTTTYRLDGFYRFNPRHSIDFGNFSVNRTGSTILDRQVEFGDVIYDVGVQVDSEFDVDLFRAAYRYSFVNDGRTEAGFVAGLSTYSFFAAAEGQVTVDDGSGGTVSQRARVEDDIIAPIPVVGVFVIHAFSPRWVLRMHAEFFDLDSGDYAGRVVDTRLLLDYYFSKNFGIGIGKNTTDITFSKDTDDGFSVDYKQDGLLAYVSFVF